MKRLFQFVLIFLLHDTINFSKPIEEYIKKYPSDWLWIHRRWKRIKEQTISGT
jgi:lauroyl/myristoyl acyltransferase